MSWGDDQLKLKAAGFSDDEIVQEQNRQRQTLLDGGFNDQEINDHFGIKEPDMKPMRKFVSDNFKNSEIKMSREPADNLPMEAPQAAQPAYMSDGSKPEVAHDFVDAFEAGLQMSVAGLALHGKPTTVMPEDAGMFMNIASQLGELLPDLPVMALGGGLGGIIGGGAGTLAAPGVGTAAGVTAGFGAGSFALPTALRTMLMQHYEKGDIKDFKDFWERMSAVVIESSKSAVVGAATAGIGGIVGKAAAGLEAPIAKTAATTMSEIATMVTVGKALEGQMPNLQDFTEAAILVGGLHSVGPISTKLRDIYAKTGLKPSEVALQTEKNPVLKQELVSENPGIPPSLETLEDKKAPTVVDGHIIPAERITKVEIPEDHQVNTQDPEMSDKFPPEKTEVATIEPETTEPKPVEPSGDEKLDSDYEKIRQNIVSKLDESNASKAKEYIKQSFKDFYTNVVDKLDPIKQAVKALSEGKDIPATLDAYKQSRMVNDAKAKALMMLSRNTIDFKTYEDNGKGLEPILEPVKKDILKFDAYLASRRALELQKRGINSGFDLEAAKNIVEKDAHRFEKVANEVTEYRNRTLDYLVGSGLLSKEMADKFKGMNELYVPFNRVLEMEGIAGKKGSGKSFKEIRGVSEGTKTQSPLESIVKDTVFFTKLAEINAAKVALVNHQALNGDVQVLEKVNDSYSALKNPSKELKDFLKFHGIDAKDVDVFAFAKRNLDLKDNEFDIWRDGKREVYKTEDPALAKALNSIDAEPIASNMLLKLAKGVSGSIRLSLSVTPDFIFRNFFGDQLTKTVFTKHGSNIVDTLSAVGELLNKKDSEVYHQWLKSGGAGGTFFDLNKDYLEKNIYNLSKETGLMDKVYNVISTPLHFIKTMGELAEQATRLSEFAKATQGNYSKEKLLEGGFSSREVTVDFQRIGAQMSVLNSITAFQNAGIQGLDRAFRAIKENPGQITAAAALTITTPTIINWVVNKDDERYKETPQWEKDLFWVVPTDKWVKPDPSDNISKLPSHLVRYDENGVPEVNRGVTYRIPKPRELGLVFGSAFERVLESFFNDNPEAFKGLQKTIFNVGAPGVIPDIATPFIETFANKSLFTGNPIVSASAEGLLPEYRYNDYTSETAKKLSSIIATIPGTKNFDLIAPAVIENWVTAWSGNLGKYALQTSDQALVKAGIVEDTKPESTLSDIPFIKAFVVRHPSSGTESLQNFYELYSEYKQAQDSITRLKNRGDLEDANKEFLALSQKPNVAQILKTGAAMSAMRKTLHNIYRNPKISPSDKRQQVDGLYYMMSESAKKAVSSTHKIKLDENTENDQNDNKGGE